MGGFADYKKRIDATIKQLNDERKKNTQILANDAFATVSARVINTGAKATGGSFEPYSPAYKKSKAKGTAKSGVGPRTVAFRDFKLSNDMWKGTTGVFDGETKGKTAFVHGSHDARQQVKIDANVKRSGNYLALSKKEIELLHVLNQERLSKTLKDNGIG